MAVELYPHQKDALKRMHDGCILCGGVGSGKSRTALAYYFTTEGGVINDDGRELRMAPSSSMHPCDLYIITTAQKRDKLEWVDELIPFVMGELDEDENILSFWGNDVKIDSWNNISKYSDVTNAFFIFDEQRVIGNGAWVKAFLKIAKGNRWILLSATPGDKWEDYIPVFIANGFYRNRSQFYQEHCVFSRFSKYPKIERYFGVARLIRLRDKVLVDMPLERATRPLNLILTVGYDRLAVKTFLKARWNVYEGKPVKNASEFTYVLRRIVNEDPSRIAMVLDLVERAQRAIIFYNYDYELEILRNANYGEGVQVAEWNGHMHQEIPDSDKWVYLVQYNAGCEGWNCIKTNTIIFYSLNYSYRIMQQAKGRIDRLNTPFIDLYYYYLKSSSVVDLAIEKALKSKKKFNEGKFYGGFEK